MLVWYVVGYFKPFVPMTDRSVSNDWERVLLMRTTVAQRHAVVSPSDLKFHLEI
jgi:hypothetical protein